MPGPHARGAPAPARIRDTATWLLGRNYARSSALLTAGFADSETGLRSYHYRLLASLEESGPRSQAELGRENAIDRSDVANWLAELEQMGLVKREVDPSNRRRNIVSLTPAGTKQLAVLDGVLDAIQERVLAPLSERERERLLGLLRKLVAD